MPFVLLGQALASMNGNKEGFNAPLSTMCRVQIAVTPIGPKLPKFQAYHSSIIIGGIEFSWSAQGISRNHGTASHNMLRQQLGRSTTILEAGSHTVDIAAFSMRMNRFFQVGTYDFLRKNCNAFTDVALYCVAGQRLPKKYRYLESVGRSADKHTRLVQAISGGKYRPNPRADGFELEAAAREIDRDRTTCLAMAQPMRAGIRF
uniref:PPPDE domain-containing protein n=1 Tax=Zooxanthella nutricula TaxID=1333877 RepID=A0A7S2K783_9DINO|mmetsp:Transcript_43040/g.130004  ORF Transcript_43040/g.130004 Transcript_43040/m.130004 type:complete len:204 (+) Transcript_43040:109-720(+)